MNHFISYRQRMKIISALCVLLAVIVALVLALLISKYSKENKKLTNELYKLDEEEYAADLIIKENSQSVEKTLDGKTEQYNFYEKLSRHLQVNVLFLGGDAMAGGGVSEASDNWVMLLVGEIENKYGSDLKGGDYSRVGAGPFYGYHILKTYPRGLKYDLVVVCYSDEENPDDFAIYYDGLLRTIKRQNSKCDVYCVIEADKDGTCGNAEAIRSLCDYYGGVCIDMNQYFNDKRVNYSRAVSDDNIPTVEGCTKYFDAVNSVIKAGLKNEREVPTKIKANLETSKLFDTYEYVTIAEMNKVSDKVYEYTTNGTIAGLIYYQSYLGGTIRVYVNGKRVLSESNKFDTNVARQVRSKVIANNLSGVTRIRIETDKAENISNIFGIAACGIKN